MTDLQAYYHDAEIQPPRWGLRKAADHEVFLVGRDNEEQVEFADRYTHYDEIDPYDCESLEPEQYLICHFQIWAFVLKTRQWGKA